MKNIFYSLSFMMLFVISCKKEKQPSAITPENIAGVYTITGMQAKADGSSKVSVYDQLTECQQNSTWDFEEDGTFLFGGVATQSCQDGDYMGSWTLSGKTFTIRTDRATTAYQLEKFTGNVLELSTKGTLNGKPATYFITFTEL